jgi:hypothetical protein
MDEEDGRLGPPPGHIINAGQCLARYGARQQDGTQDPGKLKSLIDVTGSRARQTGRVDVLRDALMMSLCSSIENSVQMRNVYKLRHALHLRTLEDSIQREVMP